jgi:methionyl aminopeptidase
MISLKSQDDLDMLKKSGEILGKVMSRLRAMVAPGVLTRDIDSFAEDLIIKEGGLPAFKGYKGYPASVCTSVNEEIVHGLPSERALKDGDIIGIDLGVNYKGYFTDAALTLAVGDVSLELCKLIDVSRKALDGAIKKAIVGSNLSDISSYIQSFVEANGFSVVRQFVGHGIGFNLHEEPEIPNFGIPGQGPLLKSGMVLAIEPMVNMGGWEADILDNGWTAVTKDSSPSAHFEHTVAVTPYGPKILTDYA